jgi:hypothetical protein
VAAAIFVVASLVYGLVAWDRILEPSPHFHFVDLAHSFLSGRLDTDTPRRHRNGRAQDGDPRGYQEAVNRALTDGQGNAVGWNDWASYRVITLKGGETISGVWPWKDTEDPRKYEFHTLDGRIFTVDWKRDIASTCGDSGRRKCDETRYFISFPPFPAVAMMPAAALWGYDTNDVLITVLFAALNAVLVWFLLLLLERRGYMARSLGEKLWIVALFAFGTVAFFSSVRGEVWFTALVIGLTLHLAYLMAALDARRPFLAGVFLALGFATRTPLLFAAVFFGLQLLAPASGERYSWPTIAKKVALFAIPCLAVGVLLMLYNEARFGSYGEFGHAYLVEGTRDSIRRHGLFSSWFLNRNLAAAITNLPVITLSEPYVHITRHGLSLFAATPAFLLLLWPQRRGRLWAVLVASTAAVAVPGLFYQNTGWAQFAYRFSLDFTPMLIALFAVDSRPVTRRVAALIALAIVVNVFGAITFGRAGMFYYD